MADAFIAAENSYGGKAEQGKVSATFLYGAARFNTFLVASCAYCHHKEDKRKFGALFG
ncbi:MAG TPA: DUF3144 domain-containing protein [Desulfocapsa sulfexigens]|nr:DUF3144 domain-containing protein [Desulfocapsa sulfexigens]